MAVHWKWHWQESLPVGTFVLFASALLPGLFLDTFLRQLALASSFDGVSAATCENTTVCVCISSKADPGHGWIIYVSNGRCCWFYLFIKFCTFMNFYSALQKIWGRICLGLISKSHKNFLGWKPCTIAFPWDPGKTRRCRVFFLANGESDNLLKK